MVWTGAENLDRTGNRSQDLQPVADGYTSELSWPTQIQNAFEVILTVHRRYYVEIKCQILPKTLIHSPHDTRSTLQQHIQRSTLNAKNANSAYPTNYFFRLCGTKYHRQRPSV